MFVELFIFFVVLNLVFELDFWGGLLVFVMIVEGSGWLRLVKCLLCFLVKIYCIVRCRVRVLKF